MTKKLWGGRFKKEIDKDFFEFQKSISYDYKLAEYDIYHSLIHINALKKAEILTLAEHKKLSEALNELLTEVETGKINPGANDEDIHTFIQNEVEKKVGEVALKLHTLRSRNDQIVFDEKFYCLDQIANINDLLNNGLLKSLSFLQKKYQNLYILGYTHTQRAQKISLEDYKSSIDVMFKRDIDRLNKLFESISITIGSGAFKGTPLTNEYDKAIEEFLSKVKKKMQDKSKFTKAESPLENVSDRDFIIEFLSILAILQMHLSRFAEDLILYSTKEFNFVDLPEEFCTGSSLMPHKKNPDFLELVRGGSGKIYGNLMNVLTVMKGLPFTYNRDMQFDKEPLFSSVEFVKEELKIFSKFIKGLEFKTKEIEKALEDESLYAVDLAEYLVRKKVSFKEAHDVVGKLIRFAEDNNCKIKDIEDKDLKNISPYLNKKEIASALCASQ